MSYETTASRDDPSTRLREAHKQIHIALERCDNQEDVRNLREALALIDGVRTHGEPIEATD